MVGLLIVATLSGFVIKELAVVLSDLGLDERDLLFGQSVAFVELGIGPFLVKR